MRPILAAALLAVGTAAAAAAPVPNLVPTSDVTIDYLVSPQNHAPVDVTVAVSAGGRHLHIVSPDLPTTIVVDRDAERAAILLPLLRYYAEVQIGRFDPERTVLRGAAFARAGERRLVGRHCTDWRAVSRNGQAAACITDDGVILRGSMSSDRNGDLGTIQARRVVYGRLPAGLFQVPEDFRKSPIPFSADGLDQ